MLTRTLRSECYWADVADIPSAASDSDCNLSCAGDSSEICGGTNRMTLYEDLTWDNPTRKALADALRDFYTLIAEVDAAIQDWNDAIKAYVAPARFRKRDDPTNVLRLRSKVLALQDGVRKYSSITIKKFVDKE